MTINVERTREIAQLGQIVGRFGKWSQRRHLLSLFGAAIGVIAGIAMSYGFVSAFGAIG
ncbi:MAG: hypothetical protein U0528_03510 [Anaerolineae bacterium]